MSIDDEVNINECQDLTGQLKQKAIDLGFPLVGITTAEQPARLHHFHRWLDNGYAGRMQYLERRRDAYSNPASILEECKSMLMLGMPYLASNHQRTPMKDAQGFGKVARYAQNGLDYHIIIRKQLKLLKRWFVHLVPSAKVRGIVDTAPLLEREFAEMAGLGWVGKNTLLLNRQWGSYFFLAALLTDQPLRPDNAYETNHCGTCTACLDHCPTQAFPKPFVLDATRCISYLTIENAGDVDSTLLPKMSGWIFGCDICQEVCPWNRKSLTSSDPIWHPNNQDSQLDVLEVLKINPGEFATRFAHSPVLRSGYLGMLRNAILVAGYQQLSDAVDSLVGLMSSESNLLRSTAAWALGQIGGSAAIHCLNQSMENEGDPEIRMSMSQALLAARSKSSSDPDDFDSGNCLP